MIQNLNYPLKFLFKVTTFSNDFIVSDAGGSTICYVRQKIFKWKDHIVVYSDESKSDIIFEFKSDRLIDFQQTFSILDRFGNVVGKIRRKGLKSLWRSTFYLMDQNDNHDYTVTEKNVWTKLWDGIFGKLPIIGMLSGYVFNPSYLLKDMNEKVMFEIIKEPSFFGRKFSVFKEPDNDQPEDELRSILSLMLMIIVERNNG